MASISVFTTGNLPEVIIGQILLGSACAGYGRDETDTRLCKVKRHPASNGSDRTDGTLAVVKILADTFDVMRGFPREVLRQFIRVQLELVHVSSTCQGDTAPGRAACA